MDALGSRPRRTAGPGVGATGAARCGPAAAAVIARCLVVVVLGVSCAASPDDATSPSFVPRSTGGTGPGAGTVPEAPGSVLILTATAGFRHESIEPAAAVLRDRLASEGSAVQVSDDPGVLTAERLGTVDVVVFLSTTGDVLDDDQQAALQAWVEAGGGWVGIHGALDAEYDWPFYETLAGAWFQVHPAVQEATVRVEDPTHPATAHLPADWVRTDEWYDLRSNPRDVAGAEVHVLATLDESTYEGGVMGADHPIAWCSTVGAGQTFVTAMGHTLESWSDPAFVDHVVDGIGSVAVPGSCA